MIFGTCYDTDDTIKLLGKNATETINLSFLFFISLEKKKKKRLLQQQGYIQFLYIFPENIHIETFNIAMNLVRKNFTKVESIFL